MRKRTLLAAAAPVLLVSAGVFFAPAASAAANTYVSPTMGICDIYASYGTPCVAANSTTHALFASYSGPLYTVQRASDGATLVINTWGAGGRAHSESQDQFCEGTVCTIIDIADQTPYDNDLIPAAAGGNGGPDKGADATDLPVIIGGSRVYGVEVTPGVGYMDDDTQMLPTGSQPQGVLMLTSGKMFNSGCCFDYGNAETNRLDNGDGHMEAVNYGGGGHVGADMENGVWGLTNPYTSDFVTAIAKGDNTSTYTVEAGDAQGGTLDSTTLPLTGPYQPMSLEGGMVLGVGGDISSTSQGDFYEGIITAGQPSAAADAAVQAEIVSEGWAYPY